MERSRWTRYVRVVIATALRAGKKLEEHPGMGAAFVLSAYGLALLALLFHFDYLPMVDLPQHVNLLAVARRLLDGDQSASRLYSLELFSPYLAGFLLPLILAHATSLMIAVKLTVWFAMMSPSLSLFYCLKGRKIDPWWCLTALLIVQGYAFDWGFLSYLVALPFAILFIGFGCRYASAPPSAKKLSLMGLATVLLFFTHALAFGFSLVIVGIVIVFASGTIKQKLIRLSPLFLAVPLVVAWAFSDHGLLGQHGRPSSIQWGLSPTRLLTVLSLQTMPYLDVEAASVNLLSVIGFLLVLRPKMTGERPFTIAASTVWILVFVLPDSISHVTVFARLAGLVAPVSVAALETSRRTKPNLARALILIMLLIRLHGTSEHVKDFNRRVGPFNEILDRAEPNRNVLTLIYQPQEAGMEAPYFLHFGHYLNARTGGLPGYSFAEEFTQIVRYKPGVRPLPDGEALSWNARRFTMSQHGGFDYFLVRDLARDAPSKFLMAARDKVRLVARAEHWFLFRKVEP